jgi:hypothetical protein
MMPAPASGVCRRHCWAISTRSSASSSAIRSPCEVDRHLADRARERERRRVTLGRRRSEVKAAAQPFQLEEQRRRVRVLRVRNELALDVQLPASRRALAVGDVARAGRLELVAQRVAALGGRGDCVTPRIAPGGSTPMASSTVGTMSIACAYCVRISPRAAMPAGHAMMNGSVEPPR